MSASEKNGGARPIVLTVAMVAGAILVASAAFNDRTLTKNETHPHKMGKDFGVTGFEALSFSPYNKTELAILKKLITE